LKNNYYICDEDYDVVIFLSIKFKIVNMATEDEFYSGTYNGETFHFKKFPEFDRVNKDNPIRNLELFIPSKIYNNKNMKREKVAHFNASLTPSEIESLADISVKVLGKVNKSGIIRYWINQYKSTK